MSILISPNVLLSEKNVDCMPLVSKGMFFKNLRISLNKQNILQNNGIELASCWTLPQYVNFIFEEQTHTDLAVIRYCTDSSKWIGAVNCVDGLNDSEYAESLASNLLNSLPNFSSDYCFSDVIRLIFLIHSFKNKSLKSKIMATFRSYLFGSYMEYIVQGSGSAEQNFKVRSDYMIMLILLRKLFDFEIRFDQLQSILQLANLNDPLHIEVTSTYLEHTFVNLLVSPLSGFIKADQDNIVHMISGDKLGPKIINLAYKIYDFRQDLPQNVSSQIAMLFYGRA